MKLIKKFFLVATAVLFVGVLVQVLGGYSNSLFTFSLVFLLGLGVTIFTKEDTATAAKKMSQNPINLQ